MNRKLLISAYAFFMLALLLALVMRSAVFVTPPFNYVFIRHAHSHLMLLGWAFPFLYLWVSQRLQAALLPWKKTLLWIGQGLVLAMFFAFPPLGYQAFTIVLTSLHLVITSILVLHLIIHMLKKQQLRTHGLHFWACLFFIVGSLGAWALGPIQMMGMRHEVYQYAIYFYLFFQINGWILLNLLAFVLPVFSRKATAAMVAIFCMSIAVFVLQNPFVYSTWMRNLLLVGAAGILLAGWQLMRESHLTYTKGAIAVVLVLMFIPTILNHPEWVHFTSYRIFYIHLIFLGILSPLLFRKLMEEFKVNPGRISWNAYWVAFGFTELFILLPAVTYGYYEVPTGAINYGLWAFSVFFLLPTVGWGKEIMEKWQRDLKA